MKQRCQCCKRVGAIQLTGPSIAGWPRTPRLNPLRGGRGVRAHVFAVNGTEGE